MWQCAGRVGVSIDLRDSFGVDTSLILGVVLSVLAVKDFLKLGNSIQGHPQQKKEVSQQAEVTTWGASVRSQH